MTLFLVFIFKDSYRVLSGPQHLVVNSICLEALWWDIMCHRLPRYKKEFPEVVCSQAQCIKMFLRTTEPNCLARAARAARATRLNYHGLAQWAARVYTNSDSQAREVCNVYNNHYHAFLHLLTLLTCQISTLCT